MPIQLPVTAAHSSFNDFGGAARCCRAKQPGWPYAPVWVTTLTIMMPLCQCWQCHSASASAVSSSESSDRDSDRHVDRGRARNSGAESKARSRCQWQLETRRASPASHWQPHSSPHRRRHAGGPTGTLDWHCPRDGRSAAGPDGLRCSRTWQNFQVRNDAQANRLAVTRKVGQLRK